jgi:hypothetical protein
MSTNKRAPRKKLALHKQTLLVILRPDALARVAGGDCSIPTRCESCRYGCG